MSETLNLEIIAEGVETEYQREFLETNGCQLYQGYYCSKPVPKEEVDKLIQKHNHI
jgi:EAL domain-containing protein (putative c-di-GMP-specific phosphodiesterase class I)